jgi:hypothetical protein
VLFPFLAPSAGEVNVSVVIHARIRNNNFFPLTLVGRRLGCAGGDGDGTGWAGDALWAAVRGRSSVAC